MPGLPAQVVDEIHDVHPPPRPNETINRRNTLNEFVGTSLRVTSGGDDLLIRTPGLSQFSQ